MKNDLPLGLAGQVGSLPTVPQDKGDDTQERFRYQWAVGVILLAVALREEGATALWCEHHEDFLVEQLDGTFVAVQVKTDGDEGNHWKLNASALVSSIARFCELEKAHGARIARYEFCSNTKCYVPGATAEKAETLASSPARLIEAIKAASSTEELESPYKEAFDKLAQACGADSVALAEVLRKLAFRQGPTLRNYDAVLAADIVPSLPGCKSMNIVETRLVRDRLISLVQNACRLRREGIDGALSYIASNGQPEAEIRAKCITLPAVVEAVDEFKSPAFRFVECGLSRSFEGTTDRASVLNRKMSNAYIGTQFESLMWRMQSAEQRLLARAHTQPDDFDSFANQIQGSVLTICKDAEAKAFNILNPMDKGPQVYATVLSSLEKLASDNPNEVGGEPVHTLMGVAGMLSGECKFSWGIPLEDMAHGA